MNGHTSEPAQADGDVAKHNPKKQLWLDAWSDPVAGVKAFNPCMRSADLSGDGDWRLIVADADKKLKVWRGTTLQSEHALLDVPVAICTFYSDLSQPRLPSLAVASGGNVYIYRNLRPYFKFALPPLPAQDFETEIWKDLQADQITAEKAQQMLLQKRDEGVNLVLSKSMDLINIENAEEREEFVSAHKNTPAVQPTVVTCMEVLKKSVDEPDAVSCLVVGTEAGQVYIMDPTGTQIIPGHKVQLPAAPTLMAMTGLLDVEFRNVVACRNGRLYTIKNGELTGTIIELESPPVGLVRCLKSIVVGCMNHVLYSFHIKGKKNYSIYLPASIISMESLEVLRQRMVKCVAVALSNGELRIYNEKHLVNIHSIPGQSIMAMRFGRFGREDSTLFYSTKTGALHIKMLPRNANLEITSSSSGPPPEQDIPLNVPKKTKLYVEQTQRERDQAIDMHRVFQRDLCKLRLQTARAYVKVLTDGQGPISYTAGSSLRLNATVQGLGPLFKIKLSLQNTGSKPVFNVPIMFSYNQAMYQVSQAQILVPILVPTLLYQYEVDVHSLDPNGGADVVRVFVMSGQSCVPVLSAIVKMPLSELAMT